MKAPGLQMQFTFRIEGRQAMEQLFVSDEPTRWVVINNELGGPVCECEKQEHAQLIRDALNKYLEQ